MSTNRYLEIGSRDYATGTPGLFGVVIKKLKDALTQQNLERNLRESRNSTAVSF